MALLDRIRKQTATYWGSPVPNGLGGYVFAAPVVLTVRWEDSNEVVVDGQGEQLNIKSLVYVGQDVDVNGYLYLGTSTASDPTTVSGASRIQQFSKVPNLRANNFLRKAYL